MSYWELGVVSFYDSFEEYDQFTQLAADYEGKDETSASGYITLDSSLTTDYRGSPFYLKEQIYENGGSLNPILGSELIIGPSSHTSYSGSIERASVGGFDSSTYYKPSFISDFARTFVAYPTSQYKSGDQVLIRTVPYGWTPYGTGGVFSSSYYGVSPIKRYDYRLNPITLSSENAPGLSTYRYEYLKAVRLYTNISTISDSNHFIYRSCDLGCFVPTVRRYRASWYYRLGRAISGGNTPTNINANVVLGIQSADGAWIENESSWLETPSVGNFDTDGHLKSTIATYTALTTDWTQASKRISAFSS